MNHGTLMVLEEVCLRCMRCARVCPVGAFDLQGPTPTINPDLCVSCMKCVSVCPADAIQKLK